MKSLEIEAIDYIISWIENVGVTYDMEVSCYEEEFKKIKQKLEVLEIIKNQHININKLENILKNEEDIEIALIKYNFEFYGGNEYILTLKEIRKLKQWLEENDE